MFGEDPGDEVSYMHWTGGSAACVQYEFCAFFVEVDHRV